MADAFVINPELSPDERLFEAECLLGQADSLLALLHPLGALDLTEHLDMYAAHYVETIEHLVNGARQLVSSVSKDERFPNGTFRLDEVRGLLALHCPGGSGYLNITQMSGPQAEAYISAIQHLLAEARKLLEDWGSKECGPSDPDAARSAA